MTAKPDNLFFDKCISIISTVGACAVVLSIPAAFIGGIVLLSLPVESTIPSAPAVGGILLGISGTVCVGYIAFVGFWLFCFKLKF